PVGLKGESTILGPLQEVSDSCLVILNVINGLLHVTHSGEMQGEPVALRSGIIAFAQSSNEPRHARLNCVREGTQSEDQDRVFPVLNQQISRHVNTLNGLSVRHLGTSARSRLTMQRA